MIGTDNLATEDRTDRIDSTNSPDNLASGVKIEIPEDNVQPAENRRDTRKALIRRSIRGKKSHLKLTIRKIIKPGSKNQRKHTSIKKLSPFKIIKIWSKYCPTELKLAESWTKLKARKYLQALDVLKSKLQSALLRKYQTSADKSAKISSILKRSLKLREIQIL